MFCLSIDLLLHHFSTFIGKQLFMFAPIRKSRKNTRRILVTANFAILQMADVSL